VQEIALVHAFKRPVVLRRQHHAGTASQLNPVVSIKSSGHYPALPLSGRAVRPDAYFSACSTAPCVCAKLSNIYKRRCGAGMMEDSALVCAYRFDGLGGADALNWQTLPAAADAANTWVHLHMDDDHARNWLLEESGIPPVAAEALLYDETRPRCTPIDDGLLLNLRGVNLNPGADPEDMVSIRLYINKDRIVSTRRRKLITIEDICARLHAGNGPQNSSEFLLDVTSQLLDRMGPVIADLDDAIDDIEDRVLADTQASIRGELWQLRRQAIALRRYVAPQREAMARLVTERISWIDSQTGQRLREIADRITRYVEDLDSGRERASIVQDELTTRLGEQMNRNMYVLSVIAGIFLPLSLLTGLLGINVAGIPGDKWPWAFTAVTVGLVVVGFIEYFLFRRLKWI
jgi:zinc transporter